MVSANLSCPSSSHQPVLSSPNSWFFSVSLVPASGRLPWLHAHTHTHTHANARACAGSPEHLLMSFSPETLPSSHPSCVPKPLRVPYFLPHQVFNFPALLSRPTSAGAHSAFPVWPVTALIRGQNVSILQTLQRPTLPLCSRSTSAPFRT